MVRYVLLLALAGAFVAPVVSAQAGEFNPMLKLGDAAPEWKDLIGVDDRRHALADLKDKRLVVLVFTCLSCPVATDYEDRIIALARKFASEKVAFVAVNVNKIEEDSLSRMKERAASHDWPFDFLFDSTQQIAKDYGATFTPEFFVLNAERRIVYMGGLDDNSNAAVASKHYLGDALTALLADHKPQPAETAAIGCQIRYERRRRSR
ncbi:MAG: thioredoxin family protein [Planctomycetes bacterium]|nr:thioredoxin family protein [Planctomycetota bacterium]